MHSFFVSHFSVRNISYNIHYDHSSCFCYGDGIYGISYGGKSVWRVTEGAWGEEKAYELSDRFLK